MSRQRDTQGIYEVEEILSESVMNYEPHFLIKWKNLEHCYDTWQPISNLGSIREYLKFWLNKQKQRKLKVKAKDSGFKTIKPYLYSGEYLSKKKSGKYAKYGEEILSRKKIWEKYVQQDEKCIDLDQDDGIEGQFLKSRNEEMSGTMNGGAQNSQINEEEAILEQEHELNQPQRCNNAPKLQRNIKVEETPEEDEKQEKQEKEIKKVKQEILEKKPKKKEKSLKKQKAVKQEQCFKVIGSIDMEKIEKIVRLFSYGGVRCLEVEMHNGQRFNIKEEQVKKINPKLLLEFYEDQGIRF